MLMPQELTRNLHKCSFVSNVSIPLLHRGSGDLELTRSRIGAELTQRPSANRPRSGIKPSLALARARVDASNRFRSRARTTCDYYHNQPRKGNPHDRDPSGKSPPSTAGVKNVHDRARRKNQMVPVRQRTMPRPGGCACVGGPVAAVSQPRQLTRRVGNPRNHNRLEMMLAPVSAACQCSGDDTDG